MTPIRKIIINITLLAEEQDALRVDEYSLQDIHHAMTEGELIGCYNIVSNDTVAPENVKDELLAIGNDGFFFGEE